MLLIKRSNNRPVFDIPLKAVGNTNLASKTEVSVEFKLDTSGDKKTKHDELVELRLYVPGNAEVDKESNDDNNDNSSDEHEEESAATVC
jgi:structure-specific recognition protein 1